jgi:hypothetical protein
MDNSLLIGDGVVLIPYVEINGARVISDDVIHGFYDILDEEGSRDVVFGSPKYDKEGFVKMLKSPRNLPVFIYDSEDQTALGLAWINGLARNHGFAHFAHLKIATVKRKTIQMGQAVMKYWFALGGDDPVIDVIVGNIPSSNKRAIRYVQRLGWTVLGEIPQIAYDGAMTVTYIERDQ